MQKGQPCWGQDARNRSLDPEALRVGQALRGRAWGEESRGGEEEIAGSQEDYASGWLPWTELHGKILGLG